MARRYEIPEDPDSERSLLSTMCQPGAEQAASECLAVLRDEDFLTPAHKAFYRAIDTLNTRRDEISIPAIQDALRSLGLLDQVGGFQGIADMLSAPEVGRPMVLVNILQGHRQRRELIRLGAQVVRQAQDGEQPDAIVAGAGSMLSKIAQRKERGGIRHISEVSDDALANLQDEMAGVETRANFVKGWKQLNRLTGGFKPGQLIILAARPGIGKTALALNWILGISGYAKAGGVFSLEMPAEDLWRRLASAHAGVDLREMVAAKDWEAFGRVGRAKAELDARGIWIEDRSLITPREIVAEVDHLITRQPNMGLLVVDYLGLISSPEGTKVNESETVRLGEITRGMKILAKDRGVPLILVCQMNRKIEERGANAKPTLADLRGSGNIEQDADMVFFVNRKMGATQDTSAELVLAKHRGGPIGSIPMRFIPGETRYEEVERNTEMPDAPAYQEATEQEPWAGVA